MNLSNLAYFVDVVQAGSISGAARKRFTSQQAVSDQIRRIEKHFQLPLLNRTTPITLTPTGQLVFHSAQRVLEEMAQLEAQVERLRTPSAEQLVISTGLADTPPFLSKVIAEFQALMPECQVTVIQPASSSGELKSPPPEADLLVGNLPFAEDVEFVELFRDPVCIVVAESLLRETFGTQWQEVDSALQQGRGYEALNELPFLFVQGLEWQRDKFPYGKASPLPNGGSMPQLMCRDGRCAMVYPVQFARTTLKDDPQLHIYPYEDPALHYRVGVGYRRGTALSQAGVLFMQAAQAYFQAKTQKNPA
ncbi:MAG: LysR family transcriptional regulator [Oscillospiraceae bacterium]|nr:LysR family transcriptional regulator [Oscillospiraceae bacterium]